MSKPGSQEAAPRALTPVLINAMIVELEHSSNMHRARCVSLAGDLAAMAQERDAARKSLAAALAEVEDLKKRLPAPLQSGPQGQEG